MKQKALDTLATRLVPVASPKVLIAYGDWNRHDGISGHAPSSVKCFKEAPRKRAAVTNQDEHRTNKLCSGCHQTPHQASYCYIDDDNEIVSNRNRTVLRCPTSDCKASFCNRDVNAALNIQTLIKAKLRGLDLTAFSRADTEQHVRKEPSYTSAHGIQSGILREL